ncbi:TPA: hypothetical protein QDB04_002291 [Burkholderia vietnamiensis]|nr:hypothetical protein [Burkholderia vietnamiensis]
MNLMAYHGTKVDFATFEPGDFSLDRMVGAHFSKTPALANLFATRNPGRKGHGKRFGGRVIPVRLTGPVYTLNQHWGDFPGENCMLTHPEKHYLLGLFTADYYAMAYDIGKVVLTSRPDLLAQYAAITGHISPQSCLDQLEKHRDWPTVSILRRDHGEAGERLMADIANAYREILQTRGYGVISYVNTAKKEQAGDLDDQTCYIALTQPKFYFEE